jgi:PBSX family phage terminase large subunit
MQNGKYDGNFYNYGHFTIFDNPNVSAERLREIESQYERGTVWYRRDILGERCAAEGIIYTYFASNRERIIIPREALEGKRIDFINIGVDFGGNKSRTTFAATAFLGNSLCVVGDHAVEGRKGEIDPLRVNEEFLSFVTALRKELPGVEIRYAFCDSEAQYLINGIRRFFTTRGESAIVMDSAKRPICDRIAFVNRLITSGKFRVMRHCKALISGLSEAVWDERSDTDRRLDNFTSDIDILDAMEYSIERYMKKLR